MRRLHRAKCTCLHGQPWYAHCNACAHTEHDWPLVEDPAALRRRIMLECVRKLMDEALDALWRRVLEEEERLAQAYSRRVLTVEEILQ